MYSTKEALFPVTRRIVDFIITGFSSLELFSSTRGSPRVSFRASSLWRASSMK